MTAPDDGDRSDRPTLYVFAISHYCEKARWALDWFGIDYELRPLAPGEHMRVAKELGAPGWSVPILEVGDRVVQGSGAIIDWAEAEGADASRRLSPTPELEDECRTIEARFDDEAGVHVRRYYYSEAIVDYPHTVRPMFAQHLAAAERASLEESWPVICKLMVSAMDLGPEQRMQSRAIVEGELDWLDGLLADGRRHLVGDRFSRADMTAASLLAPLALPKEHPTYAALEIPPLARADIELWGERPAARWVRETYRDHRGA